MATVTASGTLAAGVSRTFDIAPASAITLTLPPNSRVTVTETPGTAASPAGSQNASVVANLQYGGTFTYGPYPMGGSVVVNVLSNSGATVTWTQTGAGLTTTGTGALLDGAGNTIPLNPVYQVEPPTRGVVLAYMIQFRGVADTAGSIGTIGAVIMPEGVSAAGTRLASGVCDYVSTINGSSLTGAQSAPLGSYGAGNFITEIYLGQIGLTAPYTVQDTGNVLAATPGMTRLTWTANLEITRVQILEMGPTNFAGTAGTGSARNVLVLGLK